MLMLLEVKSICLVSCGQSSGYVSKKKHKKIADFIICTPCR
jgi:hypothetical protein